VGGGPQPEGAGLPAARFVTAARRLGAAARSAGLTVPAFRSPPRVNGAVRTLRRFRDGSVVSVTLRGRPFEQVVGDMVDGVVRINDLEGEEAERARGVLLSAARDDDQGPQRGLPSPRARMAERQTQAA
jgi:hypothetical protein